VKIFGEELAKIPLGKNWAYEFVKCHDDELESSWLKGEDLAHMKTNNSFRYKAYFELVSNIIIFRFRD
jgi:hypothetical protein